MLIIAIAVVIILIIIGVVFVYKFKDNASGILISNQRLMIIGSCPENTTLINNMCYESPPSGYNWIKPGDTQIGKICPTGTTDTSETCQYDRGIGIPHKRDCPSDQRDDGTNCWKDSYSSENGTPKRLTECPAGSYESSGSCWWNPFSVAKSHSERVLYCPDNKVDIGGFCYNNCDPGYHFASGNLCVPDGHDSGYIASTLLDRQYCSDGDVLEAGLCYAQPKPGFECNPVICSFSKDIKLANQIGTANICPSGYIYENGNCYTSS